MQALRKNLNSEKLFAKSICILPANCIRIQVFVGSRLVSYNLGSDFNWQSCKHAHGVIL